LCGVCKGAHVLRKPRTVALPPTRPLAKKREKREKGQVVALPRQQPPQKKRERASELKERGEREIQHAKKLTDKNI
jgi:hypothetical protein